LLFGNKLSYWLNFDRSSIAKLLFVKYTSYFVFGMTLSLLTEGIANNRQKSSDYLLLAFTASYSTIISYRVFLPHSVVNSMDSHIEAQGWFMKPGDSWP
jgi:hypothetical protein